ncbi:MAG: sigma-70 family RNA polymerase sigma factor [Planctomycetota bacterium]
MTETSLSLLRRLQESDESENWNELARIYSPLIRLWLRRYQVQESDADDLLQEVLLALAEQLGQFNHSGRKGSFRCWLRTILLNRLRRFWQSRDRFSQEQAGSNLRLIEELNDPASDASQLWNRQHDQYVLKQLLSAAEAHFESKTWQAFCRVTLDGVATANVASELDISVNAVCLAKSRVIRRLRQESEGLVDSSFEIRAKG